MARKPRFNLPGIPQHVIQRGNNREPCFYAEQDYCRYLDDLIESSNKYQCQIHAYVLMTNHVHLLVTPLVEHGISSIMRTLGRRYVHYINKHYRRSGTLWEGRFKASLVNSDQYLLTCMRYIELNPVRARMVGHPGEYTWSSYHANAQCKNDPLIEPHTLYLSLGGSDESRRSTYRELFQHHIDTLHDIRSALNQELVPGRSYYFNCPTIT